MSNITRYDERYGTIDNGVDVYTFEVGSESGFTNSIEELLNTVNLDNSLASYSDNRTLRIGNHVIAPYGKIHNNLPLEIRENVCKNRVLPELLEKQIRFMLGKGPVLYVEKASGKEKVREYIEDKEIQNWLNSWITNGAKEDYVAFCINQLREFYYCEGVWTKYVYNKSRRINGPTPIRFLESISNKQARLGTANPIAPNQLIEDALFDKVLIGDWLFPGTIKKKVYNRLKKNEPFKFKAAINYTKSSSFGEEIYSIPTYYFGLKEWIIGANLNPKYINSYLKNSLNAKLHVVIPYTWVQAKEKALMDICQRNKELKADDKEIISKYDGIDIGVEYKPVYLTKLINKYLEKVTSVMSGEGKNQGKLFASWKFMTENGVEDWEFKEIPTKYKEFVESIIKFDERADQVIASGKGIDPSISNISKEGVISKSGADAYYNYLIYLSGLYLPEYVCTWDINYAIHLNFPSKKDIKLGFFQYVPTRQEEVSPQNRMQNKM